MIPGRLRARTVSVFKDAIVAVAALLAGVLPRAGTAETPGRWTTAAPVPEERTEVAAAEVGGRVYVVGGFGGTQALLEYRSGRAHV